MKKDVDIRRRVELIQDFSMPGISSTVKMSRDGQYILATGIYKPRVKCFEVCNLSLKFERCLDSEVVTFEPLSDDYSKVRLSFFNFFFIKVNIFIYSLSELTDCISSM